MILGVVGAALGTMGLYFRRSVQGVIKVAADEIGSQQDADIKLDKKQKQSTESAINTLGGPNTQRLQVSSGGSQTKTFNTVSSSTGISTSRTETDK